LTTVCRFVLHLDLATVLREVTSFVWMVPPAGSFQQNSEFCKNSDLLMDFCLFLTRTWSKRTCRPTLVRNPTVDTVNLYEAKTKLSQLVERAAAGEEIIIAKAGRPLARLVPLAKRTTPRPLGLYAGQVRVGPDFEDPLPERFLRAFEE
jgi:prevent-host-death family protein